jgi:DNA-directed RNA polymerase specialized sigma subunit
MLQSRPYKLEPEYEDAYQSWRNNPTPDSRHGVLEAVRPVIDSAIRSYAPQAGSGARSRAKLLALQSLESYDPSKGKLKTHLLTSLQRLQRVAAEQDQIIRVPEQVRLSRQHLASAERELEDSLGRPPSSRELSARLGLSMARIADLRRAHVPVASGSVVDLEGNADASTASKIPGLDTDREWHEFVYHDLQPADQLVMEHTLGMFGKPVLTTQELARQLRLSTGAISQRKAKIQKMLDQRDDVNIF